MAAVLPAGRDRLFILGLGVTTIAIIGIMKQMLLHYRDSAIIPVHENKPQYITQEVEDSLKLSTLDKLLESPNYSIKETTVVIICERALHDPSTIDTLLYYITRPDYDMREKGIRALTMIVNASTASVINSPKTYAALVKSLEYSLTDYTHNECHMDWDNWHLRDVVEQGCLLILTHLVNHCGVEGLVKSRFVERWLAKEPWGGESDLERHVNFTGYIGRSNKLNELIIPLTRDVNGRRALVNADLIPAHNMFSSDTQTRASETDARDGNLARLIDINRRRRGDQTQEGEHLRRRHREAMVLNDGTRPLGRGDIFEREQ